MNIHEYQAKELLAAAGATVPKGIAVSSGEEAKKAFADLGGVEVVLKAQVHAGGRGKGNFIGADEKYKGVMWGLTDPEKIAEITDTMLKHPLKTRQTGPEGQPVSKVLVAVDTVPDKEFYLAIVMDRAIGKPVMMASTEGGVEIEEVAEKTPEKILKVAIDPDTGLLPFQARKTAWELGFTKEQVPQAVGIMMALAKLFVEKDCSLAEINPLIVTKAGDVVALDAKINFDENALFRHPDIEELRDLTEENPDEMRAAKANLSFVRLDGNIGCLVNGAGLAMSTMDIIKFAGGEPANFLDVGGGVSPEGASEAFRIILDDPNVKAILVNIFGGIAQCDLIAKALVQASEEVGFDVPVVVRLEGTNVDEGRKILSESGLNLIMATDLGDAAKKVVEASKA